MNWKKANMFALLLYALRRIGFFQRSGDTDALAIKKPGCMSTGLRQIWMRLNDKPRLVSALAKTNCQNLAYINTSYGVSVKCARTLM